MSEKPVKLHMKLEGGSLLSRKNMTRIVARASKPTDPWGNSLPSPIERFKNTPPYFQEWRIKKERKGYCFTEVRNGQGICGHHRSIRSLVTRTLMLGIPVTVEDALQ